MARSSFSVGGRASRPAPGHDVVDQEVERRPLRLEVADRRGRPEDDDRPVVHRVVERGAGQDQPVDERDGDAQLGALGATPQQPAGGRPVQQQPLAVAPVQHRDHDRAVVGGEPDVGDEALVEDGVRRPAVVAPPLGQAADGRAGGRRGRVGGHAPQGTGGLSAPTSGFSRRPSPGHRRSLPCRHDADGPHRPAPCRLRGARPRAGRSGGRRPPRRRTRAHRRHGGDRRRRRLRGPDGRRAGPVPPRGRGVRRRRGWGGVALRRRRGRGPQPAGRHRHRPVPVARRRAGQPLARPHAAGLPARARADRPAVRPPRRPRPRVPAQPGPQLGGPGRRAGRARVARHRAGAGAVRPGGARRAPGRPRAPVRPPGRRRPHGPGAARRRALRRRRRAHRRPPARRPARPARTAGC